VLDLANFIAFIVMLGGASAFFDEYASVRADCDYWSECVVAERGAA